MSSPSLLTYHVTASWKSCSGSVSARKANDGSVLRVIDMETFLYEGFMSNAETEEFILQVFSVFILRLKISGIDDTRTVVALAFEGGKASSRTSKLL
jgi:hypothetical protein